MNKNSQLQNPLSENIILQDNPQNVLVNNQQNKITCRICLEQSNLNNVNGTKQKFIRPCVCKGSVQYAHEECLIQWLTNVLINRKKKAQKKKKEESKGLYCQICKEYISVIIQQDLKILTLKQTKKRISQQFLKFLFYLIFQIFFLCVVGGLAYIAYLGLLKQATPVIIGSCVLISLLIVMLASKMIMKYFLKKQKRIIKVLQNIYPYKLKKRRNLIKICQNPQKKPEIAQKPLTVIVQTNIKNNISNQFLKQNKNQQNLETASTSFGIKI